MNTRATLSGIIVFLFSGILIAQNPEESRARDSIVEQCFLALVKRDTIVVNELVAGINRDGLTLEQAQVLEFVVTLKNSKSVLPKSSELDSSRWSLVLKEINRLSKKSFANKDLYYETLQKAEQWALHLRHYRIAMEFLSSQSIFAAMSKDVNRMANVIKRMDKFPFRKDSMNYGTYLRQKAIYHQITFGDSVLFYIRPAIEIMSRHLKSYSDTLTVKNSNNMYASELIERGQVREAADILLEAQRKYQTSRKETLGDLKSMMNLASIYASLINPSHGLKYIEKVEEICDRDGFAKVKYGMCGNIKGDIYHQVKEYDKAIQSYLKAFDVYNKGWISKSDPKMVALKLSRSYGASNDLKNAKKWTAKADSFEFSSDHILLLEHLTKAYVNYYQNNYSKGIQEVQAAFELATSNKLITYQAECLELIHLLQEGLGRHNSSLITYRRLISLKDSLYRSGQDLAISELEANHHISLREEKINTLRAENMLTNEKLKAQKKITLLTSIGLISLVMLAAFLFVIYRKIKNKNIEITKINKEKNILLKEIHHRVKNNLQVISSLLKLQSKYIVDENAVRAIADGRTRVQSMALLHQNLYREDNLKGVQMKEYFNNLVQGLFDAYNINEDKIQLIMRIDELVLDVDTVIPLGLITNELISNALKHAFVNQEKGEVKIELFEDNNQLILSVSDNGVGKSVSQEQIKKQSSFGQMLIQSLSAKLEAEIIESNAQGTEIKIVISNYEIAA